MLLSPLKISPLAGKGTLTGLSKIVSDYSIYNAWSSEHLLVSGSTTTVYDYKGEHNLSNPAALNQPTFNSSSAKFSNKPSLTFNGTNNYLSKSVSGWRASDTSGIFISVFRIVSGGQINALTTADVGAGTQFTYSSVNTNSYRFIVRADATNNSFRGSTVINDGSGRVIAHASTGSTYRININGNNETLTMIAGSNDGKWINLITGRDNINIGALIYGGTPIYGYIEWVFSGYAPYTTDANLLALVSALKTYYGL